MSVSVWGFDGTVISLSYDRRERERRSEGGRDGGGERERLTGHREGGREILTAKEKNNFFFRPAREREGGGREGRRGRERGTKGPGGDNMLYLHHKT